MLRSLSLRNFVIVDALELDFEKGFSVLTGETGAGKSILIDALLLALGGRSDAGVVRENTARADITAEFSVSPAVADWLNENEFSHEDDGVLLRRTIDQAGRSRGFINGTAATSAQLREIGEQLVDIHGQHAHQTLLKAQNQRHLLDQHALLSDDVQAVAHAYKTWQALLKQHAELTENAAQLAAQRDHLEWQVDELSKLSPQEGEWELVAQEHHRLSHAASLLDGSQLALTQLSESEPSLIASLSSLQQHLAKLADIDPAIAEPAELLDSARIQLQEATYSLSHYVSKAELDPQRLHEVESRMEALHSAARKYRVMPEALHEELDKLSGELEKLASASDLGAIQQHISEAQTHYFALAKTLSTKRRAAAASLSADVSAAMQDLSMTGGQFDITLPECEPQAHGIENIIFTVAPHAGTACQPLAKTASGGELARIALALSVITSSATATPTLIFDEVDSGIGGAVAEVVGKRLQRLSQNCQVLCVTHLPQVASQAEQHFQVSKLSDASGAPLSSISHLNHDARIEEIARMLGGVDITETTRQHAKEMLDS